MTIESPVRADYTYIQLLDGDPDEIFPLLCPVRETEWVAGWNPTLVITESGYAEPGCVFTTDDDLGPSTWVVSSYKPEHHRIEFVKFTPGCFVVFIAIQLWSDVAGKTTAECRYQYTAIGQTGRDFVAQFSEADYQAFMKKWESELNRYLVNGKDR